MSDNPVEKATASAEAGDGKAVANFLKDLSLQERLNVLTDMDATNAQRRHAAGNLPGFPDLNVKVTVDQGKASIALEQIVRGERGGRTSNTIYSEEMDFKTGANPRHFTVVENQEARLKPGDAPAAFTDWSKRHYTIQNQVARDLASRKPGSSAAPAPAGNPYFPETGTKSTFRPAESRPSLGSRFYPDGRGTLSGTRPLETGTKTPSLFEQATGRKPIETQVPVVPKPDVGKFLPDQTRVVPPSSDSGTAKPTSGSRDLSEAQKTLPSLFEQVTGKKASPVEAQPKQAPSPTRDAQPGVKTDTKANSKTERTTSSATPPKSFADAVKNLKK